MIREKALDGKPRAENPHGRRSVIAFFAVFAACAAFGSASVVDGVLTFNVAAGDPPESYSAVIGADITRIVKTGGGTMTVSTANTAFKGEVVVQEGFLEMAHKDAFGSGNTITVNSSATASGQLVMSFQTGDAKQNSFVIAGSGPDGTGAIRFTNAAGATTKRYDAYLGKLTLSASATIRQECSLYRGFGGDIDLAGHTLTLTGDKTIAFNGIEIAAGTIDSYAPVLLQNNPTFLGGSSSSFIKRGGMSLYNLTRAIPWKLVHVAGNISISSSTTGDGRNEWSGPVELQSNLRIQGGSLAHWEMTFSGPIAESAPGLEVQLWNGNTPNVTFANANNTFSKLSLNYSDIARCTVPGALPQTISVANSCTYAKVEILLGASACSASAAADVISRITSASTSANQTIALKTTGDFNFDAPISSVDAALAIVHEGEGVLSFGGASTPQTLPTLTISKGDFAVSGTADATGVQLGGGSIGVTGRLDADNLDIVGGTVVVSNGGLLYASAANKSKWTVGGANNEESAKLLVGDGGKIDFAPQASGSVTASIHLGDTGTMPALLDIMEGAVVSNHFIGGYGSADAKSAIRQYGGVFYSTAYGGGNDGNVALRGSGYMGLFGGEFSFRTTLGLCSYATSAGVVDIDGGSFYSSGGFFFGNNGCADMRVRGGTMKSDGNVTMGDWPYNMHDPARCVAGGSSTLTMYGDGNPHVLLPTLYMCNRTNGYTSVVNLNAGIFEANAVRTAQKTEHLELARTDSKCYVNFNGGTFKARGSSMFTGGKSSPSAVTVFEGGATFDPGSRTVDLVETTNAAFVVRGPSGRGVKSISLPAGAPVAGYVGTMPVAISGGGGEGATAILEYDKDTGRADKIVVTCPGWGYTEPPTVTVKGPDWTTDIVCTAELTDGEQEPGPVYKVGANQLNWNVVNNDYEGMFVVSNGTLHFNYPYPLSTNVSFRLAGGRIVYSQVNRTIKQLGGHGDIYGVALASNNRVLTVWDSLWFDANDIVQGRRLVMSYRSIKLGPNARIVIENGEALADAEGPFDIMVLGEQGVADNKFNRMPECEGLPPDWRARIVGGGQTLRLSKKRGCTIFIR